MKAKAKVDWGMRFMSLFVLFMVAALIATVVAAIMHSIVLWIVVGLCAAISMVMVSLAIQIRYHEING